MIKKIITDWVKENYGQSEVDEPSWDIDLLAKEIKKKTMVLDHQTYDYVYEAMCEAYSLLEDIDNPDYNRERAKLGMAIDALYDWYKEHKGE